MRLLLEQQKRRPAGLADAASNDDKVGAAPRKRKRSDISTAPAGDALLLDPGEARALARRVWAQDHALLALVFQAQGGAGLPARSGAPAGGAAVDVVLVHADIFFVQTLLVPPNKFRPMSMLNGTRYEHAHTVILGKVLKSCLDLADLHAGAAALRAAGADVPEVVAKYLGHTRALQNHVRPRLKHRNRCSCFASPAVLHQDAQYMTLSMPGHQRCTVRTVE
jgi:hypothetical protein